MMISHEKLLLAYADQISRQPGETVEFKVSSALPGEFQLVDESLYRHRAALVEQLVDTIEAFGAIHMSDQVIDIEPQIATPLMTGSL